MSSNSEQERERLKEEYKEHYRKIRETKEKLRRSKYVKNVNEAIQQMNADELLSSVDEFLGKVRDKMTHIEARLDVAMDQFVDNPDNDTELDEAMKKEQARDTLKQIKMEMGLLYSEIEHQAEEMKADKTVGKKDEIDETGDDI
jgi:arginine utilization protein RocB